MVTMMRFICLSQCTSGVRLSQLKVTQPRMLWLDHRLAHSASVRRKRPSTGIKVPDPRCHSSLLCSDRTDSSLLNIQRFYPYAGRARPFTHTPVAFVSSSAASASTSEESIKTREVQTSTKVPVEDAKRILRLAHPERWRLAGKAPYMPGVWSFMLKFCFQTYINMFVMLNESHSLCFLL